MPSNAAQRKPWPMKWIVLAIVLFVGGYTWVTLHYRKPGRAYEPYHDMRERANTGRLLAAGYQRIELVAQRPADGTAPANTTAPGPGGLPDDLRLTLVLQPLLATDILDANALTVAAHNAPYVVQFRCVTPDEKQQLAGAELYVKGSQVVIAPRFDRLAAGLQARSRDNRIVLTVPADSLKPGSYHVTLTGEQSSRTWNLHVK